MDKDSENNFLNDQSLTDSVDLFGKLRAGQSGAASKIFDRYVVRLIALARSRLSDEMRRRVDPEDVVQSAYRSFFVRGANGDFEIGQSGDLWRLLAQITVNKVRKQVERETAARRDVRRDGIHNSNLLVTTLEPTPEEAASFVEQVRLIVERLSTEERLTLTAYLSGEAIDEIAARITKSPRTVRRALARARNLIERELLELHTTANDLGAEIPSLAAPLPYSDFRLERMIGAGGMGKVYRATRLSTGETVAVKALRKERQSDIRAVKQFLHEAKVVAGLDHPGVIRVHGLGRFPTGGYFLVMDWIDGMDLQSCIDNDKLSRKQSLRTIEAVAEAVSHAHSNGVVHCDLKPANILIGRDGKTTVTDFGFALLIAGNTGQTAIGGTPGFIAPELLARGGEPTPAADIFSLGQLIVRLFPNADETIGSLVAECIALDTNRRPSIHELLTRLRSYSTQALKEP